ncbi:hypothetical protein SAMN03097699_2599 [Flavobacteriaceae bacterium MAR_2010_188]|nr:hypothetical protein SAMN03097699_2599 [Flavobacteriaceae bacterium MAR_2010_188]
MDFSYWEMNTWFTDVDFTIIGSGIVGLNCAIHLKEKHPNSNVLILEKGMLPQGASTKNAGFACFGSLSEILDDLNKSSEDRVLSLIEKRVKGLEKLRNLLGDDNISYKQYGGYELFLKGSENEFAQCEANLDYVNRVLYTLFNQDVFSIKNNDFNFGNIVPKLLYNPFEGQIDTGLMMDNLLRKAQSLGIRILNNIVVQEFTDIEGSVEVLTDKIQFKTSKLYIATNGFASKLGELEVKPARAQVLITKPIRDLKVRGTFHIDRGYYYFRNIGNRILFGGGRELDFETETTTEFGLTEKVQNRLEHLLKTTILPNNDFKIDHRWSGIMGVGESKDTIVKALSNNVFCGVRLGGMGIAIGSLIGEQLAELSD